MDDFEARATVAMADAVRRRSGDRPVIDVGAADIRTRDERRGCGNAVDAALPGALGAIVSKTRGVGRAEREAAALAVVDALTTAGSLTVTSDEDLRAMDARLARETWSRNLESSGIDDVLRAKDRALILSDGLTATRSLLATKMWLSKATSHPYDRNVLVLCGPPGLGKTVAAAWALARCGGVYASVATYLRDYERWLRDRTMQDGASPVLRRYKRAHLVVLDEVGRERDGDLMRDAFFKMVDERQSRRRELTIYVTNLSRADFIGRLRNGVYDDRAMSRLSRDAMIPNALGQASESMRKGTL